MFGFEDWVGGRYSMWGPIGLSLMIAIGAGCVSRFLARCAGDGRAFPSGRVAREYACTVGAGRDLAQSEVAVIRPALFCLMITISAGYRPIFNSLEMESNGKGVSMDGADLPVHSGPVVWGEPGTNGQHAFYQLIHQGTRVVPCEFLVAARGHEDALHHQHQLLVANCLAQSEALMKGRDLDEAAQ